MHSDLIDRVAWVGRRERRGPVRGIVLRFQGLGSTGKSGEDRFRSGVGRCRGAGGFRRTMIRGHG